VSFKSDARVATIEVKIAKLDGELTRFREQLSRVKNGPGKVRHLKHTLQNESDPMSHKAAIQQRALGVLKQKKLYVRLHVQ
jgi:charged multivesicular body protein 5